MDESATLAQATGVSFVQRSGPRGTGAHPHRVQMPGQLNKNVHPALAYTVQILQPLPQLPLPVLHPQRVGTSEDQTATSQT